MSIKSYSSPVPGPSEQYSEQKLLASSLISCNTRRPIRVGRRSTWTSKSLANVSATQILCDECNNAACGTRHQANQISSYSCRTAIKYCCQSSRTHETFPFKNYSGAQNAISETNPWQRRPGELNGHFFIGSIRFTVCTLLGV